MGLGHATRSLPLIREFVDRGWEVFVGSSGRSLVLLKRELAGVRFLDLPDYSLEYSDRGADLTGLIGRAPAMLATIRKESRLLKRLVGENGVDLVVSDHRYGCFSERVPSFFLSHQLRFIAPHPLRPLEFLGSVFNNRFHRRYSTVIVPDYYEEGRGLLSGRLSRSRNGSSRILYPGILSSIRRHEGSVEDIDVLVSISGPEPQRTALQEIVLRQIRDVPGRRVVALGIPERSGVERVAPDLIVHDHLDRGQMEEFMNRSRLIVARSGYSTVMELAELGKRALFIPTPGQTEQVYLARRFRDRGWFHSVAQGTLDLKSAVRAAMSYPGFPRTFSTADTLEHLMPILTG